MTENLIIFNARVVTPIGFSARCGREMEEICIMDDATVEVTGGVITYVGPNRGDSSLCCLIKSTACAVMESAIFSSFHNALPPPFI